METTLLNRLDHFLARHPSCRGCGVMMNHREATIDMALYLEYLDKPTRPYRLPCGWVVGIVESNNLRHLWCPCCMKKETSP